MARFENKQGISKICFKQNIQCYCPLGYDWYTNHITVEMVPGKVIPDYCELDDFTRGIAGKSLIIEDVVAQIWDHITIEYEPSFLRVTSDVDDAKHMPVSVTKVSE